MTLLAQKVDQGLGLPPIPADYTPTMIKAWFDPLFRKEGFTITQYGKDLHSIPSGQDAFIYLEVDEQPAYCQIKDQVLLNRMENANFSSFNSPK